METLDFLGNARRTFVAPVRRHRISYMACQAGIVEVENSFQWRDSDQRTHPKRDI